VSFGFNVFNTAGLGITKPGKPNFSLDLLASVTSLAGNFSNPKTGS
jgi:hypothetical protein